MCIIDSDSLSNEEISIPSEEDNLNLKTRGNFMIKKIVIVLFVLALIVSIGYNIKQRLSPIPIPDKIIIYSNGTSTEVDNKDFKEIVKLTNKRFTSKISTIKDDVNNDLVLKGKNGVLSIEFIYNSEQKLSIFGWGDGFKPFKYNRLFFPLINFDNPGSTETFQHGDIKNYYEHSRGLLNKSEELVNLVESLKKVHK